MPRLVKYNKKCVDFVVANAPVDEPNRAALTAYLMYLLMHYDVTKAHHIDKFCQTKSQHRDTVLHAKTTQIANAMKDSIELVGNETNKVKRITRAKLFAACNRTEFQAGQLDYDEPPPAPEETKPEGNEQQQQVPSILHVQFTLFRPNGIERASLVVMGGQVPPTQPLGGSIS